MSDSDREVVNSLTEVEKDVKWTPTETKESSSKETRIMKDGYVKETKTTVNRVTKGEEEGEDVRMTTLHYHTKTERRPTKKNRKTGEKTQVTIAKTKIVKKTR